MFKFSHLLNRNEAEKERRRASTEPRPPASSAASDAAPRRDDSIPERVRRELDEQMERLNQLLDKVESLDEDEAITEQSETPEPGTTNLPKIFHGDDSDALSSLEQTADSTYEPTSSDHSNEGAFPLLFADAPLRNLEPTMARVAAEIAPDFVFAACSTDGTSDETRESNSVREEVLPPAELKQQAPSAAEATRTHTPARAALRARPSNPIVRLVTRKSPGEKKRANRSTPTRGAIESAATFAAPHGLIQDFPQLPQSNDDELPMLEIGDREGSSMGLFDDAECMIDERERDRPAVPVPIRTVWAVNSEQTEKRGVTPKSNYCQAARRPSSAAPEPVNEASRCEPEPIAEAEPAAVPALGDLTDLLEQASISPVDLQWTSVVGAARAGSIGPQTISVAPPRSGAVLLKHENSGVVEDEVPEPIREVANSPSVAAVSAPECSTVPQVSAAASSHSVDHSATKTADRTVLRSARVVEHKEQPVTEPPVDLKDEVGIEPDRHVLNTQPLARIAFDQTDPASSQWLNVLAVLGGLLALATLGFVATDFATWL